MDLLYRGHLTDLVDAYKLFGGKFPSFIGAAKMRTSVTVLWDPLSRQYPAVC